jgi:CHASE1-domain containing sensor protein
VVNIVGVGSVSSAGISKIRTSEPQRRRGLGRHTTLAVLIVGLIISVTVFLAIRQQTITHLADSLGIQAERTTESIQRRIRIVEDTTRALGAHFSASNSVLPEEFTGFVDHILPEKN